MLRLQRPAKTSRTSSKPPATDHKERREQAKPGGAKPGHEGHSRVLSDDPSAVVEHRPDRCACCGGALHGALPSEVVSVAERIELPAVAPVVTQHRRLAVQCPTCGARVVAPVPEAARGTPFGPRLHAVATYLKTFQQWKQRLERAAYATALARRRYESVDPSNRLVARTLEQDWEAALADEHRLEAEHRRALAREPERLSEAVRQAVRRLAEDVLALWHAASTTARDRQDIARLMLERVAIRVHGATERVDLDCHWAGGTLTRHALTRPVRRFEQLEQWDRLIARITALREADAT